MHARMNALNTRTFLLFCLSREEVFSLCCGPKLRVSTQELNEWTFARAIVVQNARAFVGPVSTDVRKCYILS